MKPEGWDEQLSELPTHIFEETPFFHKEITGHRQDDLIPILVIGNRALMFNLDHIKHIRVHHGILGLLSGSLPLAPQQNTLLGLPLILSIYEVLYLMYNGIGYLVDGSRSESAFLEDLVCDERKLDQLVTVFDDNLVAQQKLRHRQYEEKMSRLGLSDKIGKVPRKQRQDTTVFLETRDNDSHFGDLHKQLGIYKDNTNVQKLLLSKLLRKSTNADLATIYQDFRVYNYLKLNYHHMLLPGVRFGGKFVSYPGDPLRYHSQLIVDTRDYYKEDIGLMDISNRGRLATGVKKLWLICGQKCRDKDSQAERTNEQKTPEKIEGYRFINDLFGGDNNRALIDTETVCFSIEWAAFG